MIKLESIEVRAQVAGIEAREAVQILATEFRLPDVLHVIYRGASGRLRERELTRDDEARLAFAAAKGAQSPEHPPAACPQPSQSALHAAIFHAAGHAIVVTDARGVITAFNPAAERLTGHAAKDLVGRATPQVLHDPGELAQRTAAHSEVEQRSTGVQFDLLASLALSPQPYEAEWTFRHKLGHRVPVMLTVTALRTAHDQIDGYLCLALDVTEPHRAKQQLAHERAVLELLARTDSLEHVLEALVLGHEALFPGTLGSVLLVDAEGRHLLRGAAPSLPEEYTNAIHGVEIGPLMGSCGTAASTGQTVVVTDIATDPLWASFRELPLKHSLRACWSTPILSGKGQVLGTFALYYREPRAPVPNELAAVLSSARLAGLAIERVRAQAQLRSFAERLALALKAAHAGIFDFDVSSGKLVWDEQMLAIFGVAPEDFSGRYEAWRDRVHPEDLAAAEEDVRAAVDGLRPFETSFRIQRPDGQLRFIQAAATLQRDAEGRVTRMTGVNIDVTEKKSLEEQVLRSQRLESVGRLAGGIAHDLNNILAPMLLSPPMLREMLSDKDGLELLDTIESSAERAASIIRQLLTFSRGTEGVLLPLDCGAIVEDMLHIVRETFPRNITPMRTGVAEPWQVLGNPTQLHQVLMNLCVNARDEMPAGGKLDLRLANRHVDAELARQHLGVSPGEFVVCSVIDEGRGIAPENMDKLFDPFFTTKRVGQGTGLGLATVLGIVQAHGGFIQVRSELGHGARFDVFLPALPHASRATSTENGRAKGGAWPRGNGELLLLVDDEHSIRRVARSMLEKLGYRVITADSGREALELFRARRDEIRLVLTDLMMPLMDGDQLVRAIRSEDPKARFVLMSGNLHASPQTIEAQVAVQAVLEKPFTIDSLLRCLQTALAADPVP